MWLELGRIFQYFQGNNAIVSFYFTKTDCQCSKMKFFLIILASTFLLCAAWTHRFTKLTSVSNQFYIKGKGKMIIPQSTWGAKITRSNFALPVTYGSEDEVYNLWCEAYVRYLRVRIFHYTYIITIFDNFTILSLI